MAAKKDKDLHYHTPTLTKWFAISSLLMAVLTVWLILDDHSRPWKKYQEGFIEYDVARTQELIAAAESEVPAQDLQALQAELANAQAALAQQGGAFDQAKAALRAAEDKLFRVDQSWRNAKAYQGTLRWEYETAKEKGGHDVDDLRAEFEHWNAEVDKWVSALKDVTAERNAAQKHVDAFTAAVGAAELKITKLRETAGRLESKLNAISPTWASKYLLNEPVLDIMAPTLKIRQAVVDNIEQEMYYTDIGRVDRCMTCHMAIDKAGYEDAPEPWKSHPKLDLFMATTSAHPMETFGCTTCHFGRDRSVDFGRAAHMPDDHEAEERWKEEHGWTKPSFWDFPMLPQKHIDATCFKCHSEQDRVPGSEAASQAEDFYEVFGCFGCHKSEGYENLRKVGPTLDRYAAKVPNRDWTHRWLQAPRGFRPKTRMPHFWNLLNSSASADVPYNSAEIRGITEYLYARSAPMEFPPLPGRGNAGRGEDLVESVGCLGCHVIGDRPEDQALSRLDERRFGPSLEGIGSKAEPEWIYQWVKDPRQYWPETRMPDLRLTDQEALDITAYLTTLRKDDFLQAPFPAPTTEARDEVLIEFYRNTMSASQATAKLEAMDEDEKWVFMGERSIARYGCFGCHDIPGFEKASPIGTELTEEGSKSVHLFDFGFIHIPHTRHDWVSTKLKTPRIFDKDRVKVRSERLKMPNFGFTDEEIGIGTTAVLSFTVDELSEEMRRTLSARDTALEAGRKLVRERNCRGCHELEGSGRAIQEALAGVFQRQGMGEQEAATQADAFAPPLITIEGAKVEPDWLFHFFQEPSTIRTWLNVRMPSFRFTDQQINTLISYFNALSEEVYPFKSKPDLRMTRAERSAAIKLVSNEYLDCFKCHARGDSTAAVGSNAAEWAPNLSLANGRLKPDWIEEWIRQPNTIQPGTRMPTYFDVRFFENTGPPDILGGDEDAQIKALVKYVLSLGNSSSGSSGSGAGAGQ